MDEQEANVCRVCMISSEVFEYCSLMEKKIFRNIGLCEAFKLITGLNISADDDYPKVVCFRCEKQLQNAYHFRQLAESSSKHFAAIRLKRLQMLPPPRILNSSQKGITMSEASTVDAGEQWIEITNRNSQNIDVTLKSESVADEEEPTYTMPEVYMVDVNGDDGNIEVKPKDRKETPSVHTNCPPQTTKAISPEVEETSFECSDQDESSDAISFLLNNKHWKKEGDPKSEAYKNRKFECTVCTKKFVGKSNLLDHLRYHANIRNYKCTFCHKTFVQSGSLKSHLRTHTAERPYICQHCNKGFGQKSALTVHIRTHTKERKYVCDTCSKAFMTSGDLVKHKQIHDPIKKYACEICGMRTAQKVNLKKHRIRVHGFYDDKIYPVALHEIKATKSTPVNEEII